MAIAKHHRKIKRKKMRGKKLNKLYPVMQISAITFRYDLKNADVTKCYFYQKFSSSMKLFRILGIV